VTAPEKATWCTTKSTQWPDYWKHKNYAHRLACARSKVVLDHKSWRMGRRQHKFERSVTASRQFHLSCATRWFLFLCLGLVFLLATTQVLHSHADDQLAGTSKHCSVCLVLHATPILTQAVQIVFSFQATGYLPSWADLCTKSSLTSFALFSRPPPLG
jgi:hypothetical protein